MSSEHTRVSTEVIIDNVISSVQREIEDGPGSSSEFESISYMLGAIDESVHL